MNGLWILTAILAVLAIVTRFIFPSRKRRLNKEMKDLQKEHQKNLAQIKINADKEIREGTKKHYIETYEKMKQDFAEKRKVFLSSEAAKRNPDGAKAFFDQLEKDALEGYESKAKLLIPCLN